MRHVRPAFPTQGFTLAELLIALAILGVIATFTIPKVLQAQQNQKYNAIAKEAAGTISQAYQLYLKANGPTPTMDSRVLTNYMNYVKMDTACTIDSCYQCTLVTTGTCYYLSNGSALFFWSNMYFDGSNTTNGIFFALDPDGKVTDNTSNGPGRSVYFTLYYNGKITTSGDELPNTWNSYSQTNGAYGPNPSTVPPWFHWN